MIVVLLALTWIVGMFSRRYNYCAYCVTTFPPYIYLCRSVFNSPANKAVVSRLVTEVRTFNPSYQASTIKGNVNVHDCAVAPYFSGVIVCGILILYSCCIHLLSFLVTRKPPQTLWKTQRTEASSTTSGEAIEST